MSRPLDARIRTPQREMYGGSAAIALRRKPVMFHDWILGAMLADQAEAERRSDQYANDAAHVIALALTAGVALGALYLLSNH